MTAYVQKRPGPYPDPDNEGAMTWSRRTDETDDYPLDLSDLLDSGDTFSAVAADDVVGVTVGSITLSAAGALAVNISNGSGTIVAKCTTTGGQVKRVKLAWRAEDVMNVSGGYY